MVAAIVALVALGFVRQAQAEEVAPEPPLAFGGIGEVPATACPAPACCRVPHVLDPLAVDPLWSGRAEALLVWRGSPQSLALIDSAAGGTALDASQLGSGMAAGPRFTLFRHTGDDGAVEFNYLRVQSFQAQQALPTTDGGYVQTPHGIFCCPSDTPIDTVSSSLTSSLQSFELNRRFPTQGGWQWLTGFRWVEWREAVAIRTTGVSGIVNNTYRSSVWNDLYGWQGGFDSILYGLGGPFRIEGLGKAGLYYDNAVQTSVRQANSTTLDVSSRVGQAAFVGEVGLTAVYDVFDWLSVRGGYAAFWLGGIAQGPNQFFAQELCTNGSPITGRTDTGGSVWIQGITLGLEARY
ncbi:MAG: hypothetical protein EBZ74_03195 [Planctomycetia bacterium]|nr:hypothetical protein [Planctomycetia bacterium]